MRVSDYYTVIINDEEMDFDKFIKLFSDDKFDTRWIEYNGEKQQFRVCLDGKKVVNLDLPENIGEDEFKQIMNVVTRYKIYLLKENINKKVKETGAFPTDKAEIAYYKEYLEKEVQDTKANVVASGVVLSIPFVLGGLTFFAGKDFIDSWFVSYTASLFREIASFLGTVIFGGFALASTPIVFDSDLRKNYENYKLAKSKLKAFNAHVDSLNSHANYTDFIQEEDNKDNAKVKKYKDDFLNEFRVIVELLEELPQESQDKYRSKLSELLKKYQERVNGLLKKGEGKIVLGEAEDVWEIFIDLLPELNKISYEVQDEVKIVRETNSFNAEVEDLQRTLSGNTKEYTDGYTDGYTDDLTSGGVAYQING